MNASPKDRNLAQLFAVSAKLTPLLDQIVFGGGCVTGLLLTDVAAAQVRPTLDVDAIIEIASYSEFAILEMKLLNLGFRREATVICRWVQEDLILDLMPTDPSILGFSNRWYSPALKHSHLVRVGQHEIRVITAPYFLATKLEAFHGRGKDDFRMSRDLEDVITVIDGRPELVQEISQSPQDLRSYMVEQFRSLLVNASFRDALPGHLLPDAASQQRITIVVSRIQKIIDLA